MAQYIDKNVLITEIERKKDVEVDYDESSNNFASYADQIHYSALDSIENFINTLEVKEVDLEKEIQAFAKMELEPIKIYDANVGITITMHQLYQCAKHFFELGLKTQKGK